MLSVGAVLATSMAVATIAGASKADAAITPIKLTKCGTITYGAKGGCVAELQKTLNERNGSGLSVDGSFGSATHLAVINYQKSRGLVPDGYVGPATKTAIYRLTDSCGALKKGSTGPCVSELQRMLRLRGKQVSVDGSFGPKTDAAVRAFQSSYQMESDGSVGNCTKRALIEKLADLSCRQSCPVLLLDDRDSGKHRIEIKVGGTPTPSATLR